VARSRAIRALFFAPLMVRRPTPSDFPLTIVCVRATPCFPSSLVTVNARLRMRDSCLRMAMMDPFRFCAQRGLCGEGCVIASLTFFINYITKKYRLSTLFYFLNDSGYLVTRSSFGQNRNRDRETQKYRF